MKQSSEMQRKKTIPATSGLERHTQFGNPGQGQSHTFVAQQQVTTIFDPDVLEKYSRMVPDAPDRVLTVFEKNAEMERAVAMDALKATIQDGRRRDWMAFTIIMTGLIVSSVFAYLEKPWLSGGALVAILSYAIVGYLQRKDAPKPAP